jgi:hypothetical protein
MSNHPRIKSSITATCGALLAALLAGQSQAQTYVATELKKASDQQCAVAFRLNSASFLNAAGDVVGMCDYFAGYVPGLYVLPLIPSRQYKPVIWRAGGAPQALSVPAKTKFNSWSAASLGLTDKGDIYTGSVFRLNWLNGVEGTPVPIVWKGGKPAFQAAPAGTSGLWTVDAVSHGGAQVISTTKGAVVVVNGREVKLPPLPPRDGVETSFAGIKVINDKGQVATTGATYKLVDNIWVAENMGGWFWTGEAWTAIEAPSGTTIKWIDAINNSGQVTGAVGVPAITPESPNAYLEQGRGQRIIWSAQTGASILPGAAALRADGRGAMNEKGQVVSALEDQQVGSNYPSAALWQPGKAAIDLNTITTLPASVHLWYALSINDKGQILAQEGDTYKPRLFLLNPR